MAFRSCGPSGSAFKILMLTPGDTLHVHVRRVCHACHMTRCAVCVCVCVCPLQPARARPALKRLLQKGQLFHNGRNGRAVKHKRLLPCVPCEPLWCVCVSPARAGHTKSLFTDKTNSCFMGRAPTTRSIIIIYVDESAALLACCHVVASAPSCFAATQCGQCLGFIGCPGNAAAAASATTSTSDGRTRNAGLPPAAIPCVLSGVPH